MSRIINDVNIMQSTITRLLKELIQKGHSRKNFIYLMDMGCALGVHAGPGSLITAIQPV